MRIRHLAVALLLLAGSSAQAWAEGTKHFQKWSVACGTDRMTDNRSCSMDQRVDVAAVNKEAHISFSIYRGVKNDQLQLMVFSNSLQPGEPVYIRVDKNPAVESQKFVKGQDAVLFPAAVIAQLQQGKQAFVRFTDRYSNIAYDADIDLQGFNEALDYLKSLKE